MTGTPRRVALVEDHPLLRAGLAAALERAQLAAVEVPLLTATDELVDQILAARPDCAVLDLGLPNVGGGLALIAPLTAAGLPLLVLTGESDVILWADCLDAGAQAVLNKSDELDVIVSIIEQVCRRQPVRVQQRASVAAEGRHLLTARRAALAPFSALTRREQEVLAALMDGLGPADIASRDFVSIQTVRTQVKLLLRKLGARSQLEAAAKAHASGWAQAPPA
jgi:DNA-binding NarL/FixJ family response regulator